MLVEYSNWKIYEGASEGSGRSDKLWLTNPDSNEIGLFKFTKTEKTTEHISEKMASELANLLGLECAKIEIGNYMSKIGSMSYLINNESETLIEGIYLINRIYPNYDPSSLYDEVNKEYYSLDMILNSLDEYSLKNEFLKIVIFDFLIGNTDRHQNNWAVISYDNNYRMCPMYDNGSSLCCYLLEEKLDSYLGKDISRFNSLVNTKSKARIRIDTYSKKEPTQLELLKYINQKYCNSIFDLIKVIDEKITESNLNSIISNYSDEVLSKKRKLLIKKFLLEKVKLMNGVFEGKEE